MTTRPTLVVVAGPNGSGKSSLSNTLIKPQGIPILDPDAIQRTLPRSEHESRAAEIAAARVTIQEQRTALRRGTSFSIETTLAGHGTIDLLATAQRHGFAITLLYVCLDSVELNVLRIRERVAQGGHAVREEDIRRRYTRSLANLPAAIALADRSILFDNSGTGDALREVLRLEHARLNSEAKDLPKWAEAIAAQFREEHQHTQPTRR
jgi:predicted ABC-type ATPase